MTRYVSWLVILVLVFSLPVMVGCRTTKLPDGTVVRELDAEAILFAATLVEQYGPNIYSVAQELYFAYREYERAETDKARERAQMKIDLLKQVIAAFYPAAEVDTTKNLYQEIENNK